MTTALQVPQIEKQCFRNDSPGWLGVTTIGPKGDDKSVSVEPGALVWLSEAEQVLTANAPRKAEDNPFIEQELSFGVDEEGKAIIKRITPLTPVDEARYVPSGSRPIPAQGMQAAPVTEPAPAATSEPESEEDAVDPEAVAARERAILDAQATPPPVPPRAAAAVEASFGEKGTVAASPQAAPPTPPAPPAPSPAALAGAEETAAAAKPPEEHQETGAAELPSQEAVQGEYAANEEVGTPQAPTETPQPYTPPTEGG